jgi:hypothetical protein
LSAHPDARPAQEALDGLEGEIQAALDSGEEVESADLARAAIEIHNKALWCRDAALALVRGSRGWAEIATATGVADATLQSRVRTWRRRQEHD